RWRKFEFVRSGSKGRWKPKTKGQQADDKIQLALRWEHSRRLPVATMVAGLMVRKYVGKVEHFLVAGREMDVYLGIASLAATEFGIVTCMYTAQNGYKFGFSGAFVGVLTCIGMFTIGITGFCIKPLRESGV